MGTPRSAVLAASTARAAKDSTASSAAFSSLSCCRLAVRNLMVSSPGLTPLMPASLCRPEGEAGVLADRWLTRGGSSQGTMCSLFSRLQELQAVHARPGLLPFSPR